MLAYAIVASKPGSQFDTQVTQVVTDEFLKLRGVSKDCVTLVN